MNDSEIKQIVADVMDNSVTNGGNWADAMDEALRDAGVELADEQPDGSDAWEIAYLADDRVIYLADESATGSARYAISERE